MKAGNIRSLSLLGTAVLCLAATACGSTGTSSASGSASATAATPASTPSGAVRPVSSNQSRTVTAYGVVRPRQFTYTGDSTGMLKDVNWLSWGADPAAGTGELWINNCVPICARGSWTNQGRVSFTLSAISSGRYSEFRITSPEPAGYRTEFPLPPG